MRLAQWIAGAIMILTGTVWIGQGTGVFPYPSYSFMINDATWAYIGAAVLIAGIAFLLYTRR
jgi:hypothetical protein